MGYLKRKEEGVKQPYKVITVDKQDEVVPVFSSLTVGVAKKIWMKLEKRDSSVVVPFSNKQI